MLRNLKRESFPVCLARTKFSSLLLKWSYIIQKNFSITEGFLVRLAFENVLRFAEVIPRIRESSFAYTLEMSTSSLRLNTCRNCPSINRYICEAYDSLRAFIFSSFISPEILCPKTYPLIICAKHDTILLRVALAFITCVSFPVWSLGNYYTQQKPRQYVFEVLIR